MLVDMRSQPMTGCALWELDMSTVPGGYSFERFRDALSARMPALPEFRMKLTDSVFNLDTPVWEEDSEFDLDRHLHRVELPAPGGRAELMEFAGRLMAGRLDRDRPLWDMWVIEGLSGTCSDFSGQVAVMHRMHHVLGDGASALDTLSRLCGTEPDSPPPQPRDGVGVPGKRQIVLDGLVQFLRRWYLLTKLLPATVIGASRAVAIRRRARDLAIPVVRAPRTSFNGTVSERRTMAFVQLDLDDFRAVQDRFNVTVNDVMLALVSGAVSQYLLDRTALPTVALIAAMPVSVRQENRASRNQTLQVPTSLHTEITDPVDRLKAIAEASSAAKEHASAFGSSLQQDWMQCAPGIAALGLRVYRLALRAGRRPMYNLIVSNVPGPKVQCYLMGATVRARYCFGPVFDGAGLNITVMSLNGNLDVGLVSCPQMLPELWEIADGLPAALTELLDSAELQTSDIIRPSARGLGGTSF